MSGKAKALVPTLRRFHRDSGGARDERRAAEACTFTDLLECKPLDVEMRRLQRAALRRLKNKGKR
jgi:hypothetical protein